MPDHDHGTTTTLRSFSSAPNCKTTPPPSPSPSPLLTSLVQSCSNISITRGRYTRGPRSRSDCSRNRRYCRLYFYLRGSGEGCYYCLISRTTTPKLNRSGNTTTHTFDSNNRSSPTITQLQQQRLSHTVSSGQGLPMREWLYRLFSDIQHPGNQI